MAVVNNTTLTALNTVIKTAFQGALISAQPEYQKIATVVTSNTASNSYAWLGEMPELREWIGERSVKDIATHSYVITNKLFESTISVQRTDIEDDNLGVYKPLAQSMGQRAAQHPDKLVFDLLNHGHENTCYDGKMFFAADHQVFANNDGTGEAKEVSNIAAGDSAAWYLLDTSQPLKPLIFQERIKPELDMPNTTGNTEVFMKDKYHYGVRARHNAGYGFWQMAYKSTQDLTPENFNNAIAAMMSQFADGGRPLGIKPTILVVPPTLRAKALEIVKAERLANGKTNVNKDIVDVLVTSLVAGK
ncbi:MAG: Mu-like prophage major head subunit gpT family protein [Gammaproteobacteria bacterium]|nr:Mu-like prophage major head subunit gpT family protein [Gammaproteobacteria bacterium]